MWGMALQLCCAATCLPLMLTETAVRPGETSCFTLQVELGTACFVMSGASWLCRSCCGSFSTLGSGSLQMTGSSSWMLTKSMTFVTLQNTSSAMSPVCCGSMVSTFSAILVPVLVQTSWMGALMQQQLCECW